MLTANFPCSPLYEEAGKIGFAESAENK